MAAFLPERHDSVPEKGEVIQRGEEQSYGKGKRQEKSPGQEETEENLEREAKSEEGKGSGIANIISHRLKKDLFRMSIFFRSVLRNITPKEE